MWWLLVLAQACCTDGKAASWAGYEKGVRWETSLEAAQKKARSDGKLVLLFLLAGDLDKEGC